MICSPQLTGVGHDSTVLPSGSQSGKYFHVYLHLYFYQRDTDMIHANYILYRLCCWSFHMVHLPAYPFHQVLLFTIYLLLNVSVLTLPSIYFFLNLFISLFIVISTANINVHHLISLSTLFKTFKEPTTFFNSII